MVDLFKGKIPIIRRSLNEGFLRSVTGETFATGAIPRNFDEDPVEMRDSPDSIRIYSENEFNAIYDEQEKLESSLFHILCRSGVPAFENLDQNGDGYCWSYSCGGMTMLDRLKQGLPIVRLNPHATAAIIKNGRDQGGWCGQSWKFGYDNGWAVEGNGPGQWPLHSRDLRHDTPELRANMALHKITGGYYDLGKREYDQELSKAQIMSLSAIATPMAWDFNKFSHSMAGVGVVRTEPGRLGTMVFQSWKGWGWHGLGILDNMWPDNAVAIRSSTPSVR